MQPLKFGNGYVISSHTLMAIWLLIHVGIKVKHCSKRAPVDIVYIQYGWWGSMGGQTTQGQYSAGIYFVELREQSKLYPASYWQLSVFTNIHINVFSFSFTLKRIHNTKVFEYLTLFYLGYHYLCLLWGLRILSTVMVISWLKPQANRSHLCIILLNVA